jgi:hypothetical protein
MENASAIEFIQPVHSWKHIAEAGGENHPPRVRHTLFAYNLKSRLTCLASHRSDPALHARDVRVSRQL